MPLQNGADLHVFHRWTNLSSLGYNVTILGANCLVNSSVDFDTDRIVLRQSSLNSKILALLICISTRSHYFSAKFNSSRYRRELQANLKSNCYDHIVFSFLSSLEFLDLTSESSSSLANLYCETHNYEPEWFAVGVYDVNAKSFLHSLILHPFLAFQSLLAKILSSNSIKYLRSLKSNQKVLRNITLINISVRDTLRYRQYFRNLPSISVMPSFSVSNIPDSFTSHSSQATPRDCQNQLTHEFRIVFAGSLSNNMNIDALKFFSNTFWKEMVSINQDITFTVIGSNPSRSLERFIHQNGWCLLANLPANLFKKELSLCDLSILPFMYSCGAKLKLIESLSNGIPFLATNCVNYLGFTPPFCLFSDSPSEWAAHLSFLRLNRLSTHDKASIVDSVSSFSRYNETKYLDNLMRSSSSFFKSN